MSALQLIEADLPAQCRVHDVRSTAGADGCFKDGQRHRGDAQTAIFHKVVVAKVATAEGGSGCGSAVTVAWHGDLHGPGLDRGQPEPPGGGEAARGGPASTAPHCRTRPRRRRERTIIDEIDPGTAMSPLPGPHPAANRMFTEAGAAGLRQGDDAVMAAQIAFDHIFDDAADADLVRSGAFACAERRLSRRNQRVG